MFNRWKRYQVEVQWLTGGPLEGRITPTGTWLPLRRYWTRKGAEKYGESFTLNAFRIDQSLYRYQVVEVSNDAGA